MLFLLLLFSLLFELSAVVFAHWFVFVGLLVFKLVLLCFWCLIVVVCCLFLFVVNYFGGLVSPVIGCLYVCYSWGFFVMLVLAFVCFCFIVVMIFVVLDGWVVLVVSLGGVCCFLLLDFASVAVFNSVVYFCFGL